MSTITTRDIAAYSGGWIRVPAGQHVRIIDIEGQQVADMFAIAAADPGEWLSTANTRSAVKHLFPRVTEHFLTNRYNPILTFIADRSPGAHDMLHRSCDPYLYRAVGVTGEHPNCHANFQKAVRDAGLPERETPDPVNFFQNTPLDAAGELHVLDGVTKAGDYVELRAEMDLVLVVTACSWDVEGMRINGEHCTGIRLALVT